MIRNSVTMQRDVRPCLRAQNVNQWRVEHSHYRNVEKDGGPAKLASYVV